MTRNYKLVGVLVALLCIAATTFTPSAALAQSLDHALSPSPAPATTASGSQIKAKGFCSGSTSRPELQVNRDEDGNPTRRWVVGQATQNCGGGYYMHELCIKLQVDVTYGQPGAGAPVWLDVEPGGFYHPTRCPRNSGPNVTASFQYLCANLGEGFYRSAARGRVWPAQADPPEITRYGYSAGRLLCS